jgi:hypothetical protein
MPDAKSLRGEGGAPTPLVRRLHTKTFTKSRVLGTVRVPLEGSGTRSDAVGVGGTGKTELPGELARGKDVRRSALIEHLVGFRDERIEPACNLAGSPSIGARHYFGCHVARISRVAHQWATTRFQATPGGRGPPCRMWPHVAIVYW